jgi:hypothetical protein
MKECAYCGKANDDDAVRCTGCGTAEFVGQAASNTPAGGTPLGVAGAPAGVEFLTPTSQEMKQDLVTLMRCRTLPEADMFVAQLEAADIPAFIPDEFLLQNIAFNLSAYGYVRIQVSPDDYGAAKGLLSALPQGGEGK